MSRTRVTHSDGSVCVTPWVKTNTEHIAMYDVTKEMADDWILYHDNINRGMKAKLWAKYLRDRVNGKWLTTHQAVAFDRDGEGMDGQHRWQMVSQSGLTTRLAVGIGFLPEVRMVIDIGNRRTACDVLQLINREDATIRNVAVVRCMMNGKGTGATIPEIVDAYDILSPAANKAISFFPKQNVKNKTIGPVTAVLACASFTETEDKLEEFASLLIDPIAERGNKGHKSAVLLAKWLEAIPSRAENLNKIIYGYTEAALAAFLANEALTELYMPEEELFVLPEAKKMKKGRAKLRVVGKAA